MLRELRRYYKCLISFLLTIAIVFSNTGANLGVVFAAEERQGSLFLLDGEELEEAIETAVEEGQLFDFESLELKTDEESQKKAYEKLLGAKAGSVYQLDVAVDDTYACEDTSVQVFYREDTEDMVLLYVNEGTKNVNIRINIDGYQTQAVMVRAQETAGESTVRGDSAGGNSAGENVAGTLGVKTPEIIIETEKVQDVVSDPAGEGSKVEILEIEPTDEEGMEEETSEADSSEADSSEPESVAQLSVHSVYRVGTSANASRDTQVKIEEDSVDVIGTLKGRTYNTVTIWESASARAFYMNKKTLDKVIRGSRETFGVSYVVEPETGAWAEGPEDVAEGDDLVFMVVPEDGYEIEMVTANGMELEAADVPEATPGQAEASESDIATPYQAEKDPDALKGGIFYMAEDISEDQEIVIVMKEVMSHPEFIQSKIIDGVTVTVQAEEGVLPEGTELEVTDVTEAVSKVLKEKASSEGTKYRELLAYDINLMLNGKKLNNDYWGREHEVTVTYSGEKIEELTRGITTLEVTTLETPVVEVEAAMGGTEQMPDLDHLTSEAVSFNEEEKKVIEVPAEGLSEVQVNVSHFSIQTLSEGDDSVHQDGELKITLADDAGTPIEGTTFKLYRSVNSTNSETGKKLVSTAVTDENGIAYLSYLEADPGNEEIEFPADGEKYTSVLSRIQYNYYLYIVNGASENKIIRYRRSYSNAYKIAVRTGEINAVDGYELPVCNPGSNVDTTKPELTLVKIIPQLTIKPRIEGKRSADPAVTFELAITKDGSPYTGEILVSGNDVNSGKTGIIRLSSSASAILINPGNLTITETIPENYYLGEVLLNSVKSSGSFPYSGSYTYQYTSGIIKDELRLKHAIPELRIQPEISETTEGADVTEFEYIVRYDDQNKTPYSGEVRIIKADGQTETTTIDDGRIHISLTDIAAIRTSEKMLVEAVIPDGYNIGSVLKNSTEVDADYPFAGTYTYSYVPSGLVDLVTMVYAVPSLTFQPVIQGSQQDYSDAEFQYTIKMSDGLPYTGAILVDHVDVNQEKDGKVTLKASQTAEISTSVPVTIIQETIPEKLYIERIMYQGVIVSTGTSYECQPTGFDDILTFVYSRDGQEVESELYVTKTAVKASDTSNGVYDVELTVKGKPSVTYDEGSIDVVLILDVSSSMVNQKLGDRTRLEVIQEAAMGLAAGLLPEGNPNRNRIAVAAYDGTRESWNDLMDDFMDDYEEVEEVLAEIPTNGSGTNCEAGFLAADELLDLARTDAQKYLIYLSDGEANKYVTSGKTAVRAAIDAAKQINLNHPDVTIMTMGITTAGEKVLCPEGDDKYWTSYTLVTSADEAIDAFTSLLMKINDKYEKPIVQDVLGENVELVSSVALTTVKSEGGAADEVTCGTASAATQDGKTVITWDLIDSSADANADDQLASLDDVYKLRYQVQVKEGITDLTANYDKTGDSDTGTHAGQSGWWSNEKANLYLNHNVNSLSIAAFPQPAVQKVAVRVLKKDAQTDGALNGAVFRLSEQDPGTRAWSELGDYTTSGTDAAGTAGTVTFSDLKMNTLYRLEEISAPEHYLNTTEPVYVKLLRDSDGNGAAYLCDEYGTADASPIIDGLIEVKNTRKKVDLELTVKKTTAGGETLGDQTFEFTLAQLIGGQFTSIEIPVTLGANQTATVIRKLNNLPAGLYKLTEKAHSNFTLTGLTGSPAQSGRSQFDSTKTLGYHESERAYYFDVWGENGTTQQIEIAAVNSVKKITPGKITITKRVPTVSDVLTENRTFQFTIQGPDGKSAVISIGTSDFNKAVDVTDELLKVWDEGTGGTGGLPLGTYTVTEGEDPVFELNGDISVTVGSGASTSGGFVLSSGNGNADIVISAENQVRTSAASIQVQKKLEGADVYQLSEEDRKFTFTLVNEGTGECYDGSAEIPADQLNVPVTVTWKKAESDVTLTDLPYGTYTLTETSNSKYATGWNSTLADTDDQRRGAGNTLTFHLLPGTAGKVQMEFTNTLHSHRIQFTKVDSSGETVSGLNGAEFGLYLADQVTTDAEGYPKVNEGTVPVATAFSRMIDGVDGVVKFDKPVAPGSYKVIEIQKLDGYEPSKTIVTVNVGDDGNAVYAGLTAENRFPNYLRQRQIQVEKEFEPGNVSEVSAMFGLYSHIQCSEADRIETVTVTADSASGWKGTAVFTTRLNPGTYYVKEIADSAKGYTEHTGAKLTVVPIGEYTINQPEVITVSFTGTDKNLLDTFGGSIKITKVLTEDAKRLLTASDTVFTFAIYDNAAGDGAALAQVSAVWNQETQDPVTVEFAKADVEKLKVYTTYYLKETVSGSRADDFELVQMIQTSAGSAEVSGGFVLTPEEVAAGASFEVTNTAEKTGNVEIEAVKIIEKGSSVLAKEEFKVELQKCFGAASENLVAGGFTTAFNTGSQVFDLDTGSDQNTVQKSELMAGVYKVVESSVSNPSKYDLKSIAVTRTYLDGENRPVTEALTVDSDGSFYLPADTTKLQIKVINQPVTDETAGLEVTKHFVSGHSLAQGKTLTFKLTKKDDESFGTKIATVTYGADETVGDKKLVWNAGTPDETERLQNLQLGQYILTEVSDAASQNYESEPLTIDITGENTVKYEYVISNTAKKNGSLTVTKAFVNEDEAVLAEGKEFQFQIKNLDTEEIYTGTLIYEKDGTKAVSQWTDKDGKISAQLPYGTYTIEEKAHDLFEIDSFDGTTGADNRFVIQEGAASVKITANNKAAVSGNVTIAKSVTGFAKVDTYDAFDFTVYDVTFDKNKDQPVAYAKSVAPGTTAGTAGTAVKFMCAEELEQEYQFKVGHRYLVTEGANAYYDPVEIKITAENGTAAASGKNGASFTINSRQTKIELVAVNKPKTIPASALQVKKKLTGVYEDLTDRTFTFTMNGTDSTYYGKAVVDGECVSVVWYTSSLYEAGTEVEVLPYDTYTIVESNSNVLFVLDSIETEGSGITKDESGKKAEVTVSDETVKKVTFVNKPADSSIGVTVNKEVLGGYSLAAEKDWTFRITLKNSRDEVVEDKETVLKARDFTAVQSVKEVFKAENLPYGIYTLTEEIIQDQETPVFRQESSTVSVGAEYKLTDYREGGVIVRTTFEISPDSKDGVITIRNDAKDNGSLQVTKTVPDKAAAELVAGKTITFEIKNQDTDQEWTGSVVYATPADAQRNTVVFKDLPYGTYEIAEIDVDGAPVELESFTGAGVTGTAVETGNGTKVIYTVKVSGSEAVEVTAVNKPLTSKGNVKVTKLIRQENTSVHEGRNETFDFKLYDITDSVPGTVVAFSRKAIGSGQETDFVDRDSGADFQYIYGHRYLVEEFSNQDYELIGYQGGVGSECNEFVFTDELEAIAIEAENSILKGNLEIEKVDAENTEWKLSGVTFELYVGELDRRPGSIIRFFTGQEAYRTGVTDEEGKLRFEDLPLGIYTLFETETDENHELPSKGIVVEIGAETTRIEKIGNARKSLPKASVKVSKTTVGNELSGKTFRFSLYRVPDGKIGELTVLDGTTGSFDVGDLSAGLYYIVEEASLLYETEFCMETTDSGADEGLGTSADGTGQETGLNQSVFEADISLGQQNVILENGMTEKRFYFDLLNSSQNIAVKAVNTVNRWGNTVGANKIWTAEDGAQDIPETLSFTFKLEQKKGDHYEWIAGGHVSDIARDTWSCVSWIDQDGAEVSELKDLEYGTYRISEVISADAIYRLNHITVNGVTKEFTGNGYEFRLDDDNVQKLVIGFSNCISYQAQETPSDEEDDDPDGGDGGSGGGTGGSGGNPVTTVPKHPGSPKTDEPEDLGKLPKTGRKSVSPWIFLLSSTAFLVTAVTGRRRKEDETDDDQGM